MFSLPTEKLPLSAVWDLKCCFVKLCNCTRCYIAALCLCCHLPVGFQYSSKSTLLPLRNNFIKSFLKRRRRIESNDPTNPDFNRSSHQSDIFSFIVFFCSSVFSSWLSWLLENTTAPQRQRVTSFLLQIGQSCPESALGFICTVTGRYQLTVAP